jgi:hypothetical protein
LRRRTFGLSESGASCEKRRSDPSISGSVHFPSSKSLRWILRHHRKLQERKLSRDL